MENSLKSVAIMDCDSIVFTAFHPNKVLDDNSEPVRKDNKFVYIDKTEEEIIKSADSLMSSILTKSKSDGYIAFIKGKGNYRYSINSEYKANRPKESPKFWNFTKQHLIDKWNAVEVNGIEVDDAVNITRLQIPNSFICALDKDLLHLQGTNYNWSRDKWTTISESEANYKFWSDMICGQTGDGLPGLKGRGIKFVENLFTIQRDSLQCVHTYHSIVLDAYIDYFNEELGIEEYYKSYKCLKILDNYKGFLTPEITKYEQTNINVEEF